MKKIIWYLVILLLIAIAIYSIYIFTCNEERCIKFDWQKELKITSFDECVESGYKVVETIPRQCVVGNKVFTEGADTSKSDLIRVTSLSEGQRITSPLVITGEARGTWFFEASFPIKVYDANGKLLGTSIAQAQSEWMTTDFVPFRSELIFATSTTATGTIVFIKDNPSGLPEYDNQLEIRVSFRDVSVSERTVKLYFYDASKDKDVYGNIMCSKQGLVAVDRNIPITQTPVQDTVRLLLLGGLTKNEKNIGITTEYPLPGFSLDGASTKDGELTLNFSDPLNKTIGGSCRVSVLWAQIEATAKQFGGVKTVKFSPTDLFQP